MGSKAGIRVERTLGASTRGLEVGLCDHSALLDTMSAMCHYLPVEYLKLNDLNQKGSSHWRAEWAFFAETAEDNKNKNGVTP